MVGASRGGRENALRIEQEGVDGYGFRVLEGNGIVIMMRRGKCSAMSGRWI